MSIIETVDLAEHKKTLFDEGLKLLREGHTAEEMSASLHELNEVHDVPLDDSNVLTVCEQVLRDFLVARYDPAVGREELTAPVKVDEIQAPMPAPVQEPVQEPVKDPAPVTSSETDPK